jgi:hypothetical protein
LSRNFPEVFAEPCGGGELFDAMMAHFGNTVDVIQAEWSDNDPKLKTNLDAFNAAIVAGDLPEVAAAKTPTGKYAVRAGYTPVSMDRFRHNDVSVYFRRSSS